MLVPVQKLTRVYYTVHFNYFYIFQILKSTYLVTLKTLRRRSALNPERPKDPARGLKLTQNTSKMDPKMTTQSNLLKAESK